MQLALPIETGVLIPADDSVRLLSQILEELDYSITTPLPDFAVNG